MNSFSLESRSSLWRKLWVYFKIVIFLSSTPLVRAMKGSFLTLSCENIGREGEGYRVGCETPEGKCQENMKVSLSQKSYLLSC